MKDQYDKEFYCNVCGQCVGNVRQPCMRCGSNMIVEGDF